MSEHTVEDHAFFWNYHYGMMPLKISPELMTNFSKAVLTIIGADGQVAPAERAHFLGLAHSVGAPAQMVEFLKTYDPKNGKLEDCLEGFGNDNPARVMLYDAIQTARADGGYHPAEKAAVAKAARILGIDQTVVAQIEGLVEMEETLRKMRGALFSADVTVR